MRQLCNLVLALGVTVSALLGSAVAEETPLKALIITGGCCHDYSYQTESIQKALKDRKVAV